MTAYKTAHRGNLILGVLFVGLGILFLLEQLTGLQVFHYLWPLLFVAVGLGFFAAMFSGGPNAGALAIPGSIFVMLGLVFLYQNAFNHFESWAYAWALVAPTGAGIGLSIFGWWTRRADLRRAGVIVTGIGLLIFLVGGAFFELLFSLVGIITPARFLFPLALVVGGVLLLFKRNLLDAVRSWLSASELRTTPDPQAQAITNLKSDTVQSIVEPVNSTNQGGIK